VYFLDLTMAGLLFSLYAVFSGDDEVYGFANCHKLLARNPTGPTHQPDCVTLYALCKPKKN
jgi:hypothetical protein